MALVKFVSSEVNLRLSKVVTFFRSCKTGSIPVSFKDLDKDEIDCLIFVESEDSNNEEESSIISAKVGFSK